MKLNREVGSISMVRYNKERIAFDLISNDNGMHTIFALDLEMGKYGIHRWITRSPNMMDKDFDGIRYKCKIIGVDEL